MRFFCYLNATKNTQLIDKKFFGFAPFRRHFVAHGVIDFGDQVLGKFTYKPVQIVIVFSDSEEFAIFWWTLGLFANGVCFKIRLILWRIKTADRTNLYFLLRSNPKVLHKNFLKMLFSLNPFLLHLFPFLHFNFLNSETTQKFQRGKNIQHHVLDIVCSNIKI